MFFYFPTCISSLIFFFFYLLPHNTRVWLSLYRTLRGFPSTFNYLRVYWVPFLGYVSVYSRVFCLPLDLSFILYRSVYLASVFCLFCSFSCISFVRAIPYPFICLVARLSVCLYLVARRSAVCPCACWLIYGSSLIFTCQRPCLDLPSCGCLCVCLPLSVCVCLFTCGRLSVAVFSLPCCSSFSHHTKNLSTCFHIFCIAPSVTC